MITFALLLALIQQTQQASPLPPLDPANTVLESVSAQKDWEPNADPDSAEWTGIEGVQASRDSFGQQIALPPTEIRSRWTRRNLYLLFICPYTELNLKPDPSINEETDKLWNWDVAE